MINTIRIHVNNDHIDSENDRLTCKTGKCTIPGTHQIDFLTFSFPVNMFAKNTTTTNEKVFPFRFHSLSPALFCSCILSNSGKI
jgi:hypothetical protein